MKRWISSLVVPFVLVTAAPASAIVHLWDIVELYSNADGSIQYIELATECSLPCGGEFAMSLTGVLSDENAVNITDDLVGDTSNRRYLLATPGFENLPGVAGVVPDFPIEPGFFSVDDDTIQFGTFGPTGLFSPLDTLTFGPGELPTDGVLSLNRALLSAELVADTNSPTNFAGMTGTLLPEPDQDADGVPDAEDNCTEVPNADQRDTNLDGYGNLCDPDLNNDGAVDFLDLGLFKAVFFTDDADADLNGDGSVDFLDLGLMKSLFFQPPGPSGLSCAGTVPCPDVGECATDDECNTPTTVCEANFCVPGCSGHSDCAPIERCDLVGSNLNHCEPRDCLSDADCSPPTTVCDTDGLVQLDGAGYCLPGCAGPSDCPVGFDCNVATGACAPVP